ncbi:MAG TPA: Fic family protein [Clostridia bacterium]
MDICLSRQDNLELAQKYLTKGIYSCAKLANINITPYEIQAVLEDIDVSRISDEHKRIIKNLQKAWQYALDNLDKETNLEFLSKINSIILEGIDEQAGKLRAQPNEKNLPPPNPETVKQDLDTILKIEDTIEKALEYFLYGCKYQLFPKGNKRTVLIGTNSILIKNGAGLLLIQDKDLVDFNLKSLYYYNTSKSKPFKDFLYENCIITQ